MAFGYGYYNPGGYYPQYQQPNFIQPQQQPPYMQTAQQQSGQSIIWVPNEAAARDYPVAANNAVQLWDSSAPVAYLKTADASGKATLKIYDLVERQQQATSSPQQDFRDIVTRKEYEGLSARVDALEAQRETARTRTLRAKKEDEE